jgi:phosphoglycolate phosphatase
METGLKLPGQSVSRAVVVFDLDGTIADTAPDLIEAANTALASEGLGPAPAAAIRCAVGHGARAMLSAGIEALGGEPDAEQVQRLIEHYEQNIAVKTQLFPGFGETAANLRSAGAKLLLCTNKRQRLTFPLLSALGIGSLFDAIACGDTFPYHKPDPRHISDLVQLAGGELGASVMVGDSEVDAGAAHAAGIPFIAVSFGYPGVPLAQLGAEAVIGHFCELPALVSRLCTATPSAGGAHGNPAA